MRRVLATALMSLLLAGSAFPAAAMDNPPLSETSPETSAGVAPDGDPAAPAAADPGADEAGAPPSEDQAGANDDVMQKFTRHRPGACPEGPPCNVED
jgi:hypothetical protein